MNIFDGTIVIVSLLEIGLLSGSGAKAITAFRSARILRVFRVLRLTRLLRTLAFMKVIVGVIGRTAKSFFWICFLGLILMFIYALLGMQLFGGNLEVLVDGQFSYDTFIGAFLGSFQILVGQDWNGLMQSVFASNFNQWVGGVYLCSWYIIGNWILLRLLLAIILNEFGSTEAEQDKQEIEEEDLPRQSSIANSKSQGTIVESNNNLNSSTKKLDSENQKSAILTHYSNLDPVTSELSQDKSTSCKKPLYDGNDCEASCFYLHKSYQVRVLAYRIITHPYFETLIISVIIANSLMLAIQTYFSSNDPQSGAVFTGFNDFFNIFFAVEMVLKIISLGFILDKGAYLRDSWNILDFIIVVTSLLDMSLASVNIAFIRVRPLK